MKTKFIFLIVLIVSIFSTVFVSQEKLTFGIKGGIGFWQFKSLQSSQNIGHPIDYSYPQVSVLDFILKINSPNILLLLGNCYINIVIQK